MDARDFSTSFLLVLTSLFLEYLVNNFSNFSLLDGKSSRV